MGWLYTIYDLGLVKPPARPTDVEAFDFTPGPECIATESLRNLTQVWGAAGGRT
jgi:hypothetical protein